MGSLPFEYASVTVMVNTADSDGIISEGFGTVRVRALEGRAVALEITDALSGLTAVAVLDFERPKRALTGLQADVVCEGIRAASREDGLPVLFPQAT